MSKEETQTENRTKKPQRINEQIIYEENGVVYERLTIDLPKPIADFYRFKAHVNGLDDLMESLIAFDISDHLDAEIEGNSPTEWQEFFNLGPALDVMFGRQELLLRNSPRSKER